MVFKKFIAFRGDKELVNTLEQNKKRMGFKSDSDYIRYLIRNNDLIPNLMNIKKEMEEMKKEIKRISNKRL